MAPVPDPPRTRGRALGELALLFARLGATAFGGPAAHIALMEQEVVRRRRWLTRDELMDLVGACHLIPGPTSTELAIHIGHRRAGAAGLLVAGAAFILPAAAITVALAHIYVRWGRLPAAEAVLRAIKPVMIAVVVEALFALGGAALKRWSLVGLAAAALAAAAGGVHELVVLLAAGLSLAAVAAARRGRTGGAAGARVLVPLPPTLGNGAAAAGGGAAAVAGAVGAVGLGPLFWSFLKVGSVLFGSGYVLLALLRAELVVRLHWLDERQLLDAVAIGQLTPGPVFTTASFIGYLLRGLPGAAVATAGIFLPAFVFVAASGPLLPRLRRSAVAGAFLDGVNAASLALMVLVTVQLARAAVVDLPTALLAIASALLLRVRVPSTWIIAGGALVGLALHYLGGR